MLDLFSGSLERRAYKKDFAYWLSPFGYSMLDSIILFKSFYDFISNGMLPVNISKPSIPIDHKSTFSSYLFPFKSYGDTYSGVPQNVSLRESLF